MKSDVSLWIMPARMRNWAIILVPLWTGHSRKVDTDLEMGIQWIRCVQIILILNTCTFSVTGVVGTRRFCSSRDMHNICQYMTYPDHDRVYRACVFTCRGDGCNSGTLPNISLVAMILSFLCLSIFLYWWVSFAICRFHKFLYFVYIRAHRHYTLDKSKVLRWLLSRYYWHFVIL